MSHLKERKEKVCLNCGAEIHDRFCHKCGQENIEPKETVWHFITHFFNDITHFDGKLFSTIKVLITKPGFLSSEYLAGRRAKYLNPIRMYLFLSFILFLLKLSLPETYKVVGAQKQTSTNQNIATTRDSIQQRYISYAEKLSKDSINYYKKLGVNTKPTEGLKDTSIAQYLARQKALPESQRDGWLENYVAKRAIILVQYMRKHNEDIKNGKFNVELKSLALPKIPQMLFISIPFFALILYFLYIRSRKHYYFVSHGIFTLHLYSTIFLFLIIKIPFAYIHNDGFQFLLETITSLLPAVYLFFAMKEFYQQGIIKTFIKWLLTMFFSSIIFIALLIILVINILLEVSLQAAQ